MLERTARTSTFDGFSYVDDAHTNSLLEWGASREEGAAAKKQNGSRSPSRGSSLSNSPGSRSPNRSPASRSPVRQGNSYSYSSSPSRLRNQLQKR